MTDKEWQTFCRELKNQGQYQRMRNILKEYIERNQSLYKTLDKHIQNEYKHFFDIKEFIKNQPYSFFKIWFISK